MHHTTGSRCGAIELLQNGAGDSTIIPGPGPAYTTSPGCFTVTRQIADGWHIRPALAYEQARRNATNPRFAFGSGKLGDLAAFASAIVLALTALLTGYESQR